MCFALSNSDNKVIISFVAADDWTNNVTFTGSENSPYNLAFANINLPNTGECECESESECECCAMRPAGVLMIVCIV